MDNIVIRKITSDEVDSAMALALEVFMEFEAPDYGTAGVETFKKEYHRKGIARAIFKYLLNDVRKENPTLEALTLNSSPYGLPFYLALGFIPLTEEQEINGIRFTPMKYLIKK